MKKSLSIVAIIALAGSTLMAGGDIVPVQAPMPHVEMPAMPEISDSGFYLGAFYGASNIDSGIKSGALGVRATYFDDVDYGSFGIDAGYKFNSFIAVEGRYWFGADENANDILLDETFSVSNDTWALYVKPMYPVTDTINVYALLGYANSDFVGTHPTITLTPDTDYDGFSWGIGADYEITDNISVFVDYTNMFDESYDSLVTPNLVYADVITSWNFGFNYKF